MSFKHWYLAQGPPHSEWSIRILVLNCNRTILKYICRSIYAFLVKEAGLNLGDILLSVLQEPNPLRQI